MRQVTYSTLRRLPSAGTGGIVFVTSIWAAVDDEGFKHWFATRDLATTGALIAILIALYVLGLWLTREWNSSDRDAYRGKLQDMLVEHTSMLRSVEHVKTDEDCEALGREINQLADRSIEWFRANMGEAAIAKYLSGTTAMGFFMWEGEHTEEAINHRSNILSWLHLRLEQVDAMMGCDTWDHPVPLAKRKRVAKWAARKEWLWTKIGRTTASTAS